VLTQITEALEAEQINTERFRRQLTELLNANNQSGLVERIRKGSDYYKNQLWQNSKLLLHHLEVTRQQKRVKTYLTQLTDLDQSLSKKLEEVDKAVFLTEAILKGEDKFEFSALNKERSIQRNAILSEIRKEVEKEIPTSSKKKARKDRKPKKDDGRTTYDITLELLNNGFTVAQIAKERGMVVSTIETHLAKAVAEGRADIFKFMPEETVMEIINVQRQLPEGSTSKDLFDALKGKFGYGQLRAVMAYARKA
jgi:uncharacterized protein YpbB